MAGSFFNTGDFLCIWGAHLHFHFLVVEAMQIIPSCWGFTRVITILYRDESVSWHSSPTSGVWNLHRHSSAVLPESRKGCCDGPSSGWVMNSQSQESDQFWVSLDFHWLQVQSGYVNGHKYSEGILTTCPFIRRTVVSSNLWPLALTRLIIHLYFSLWNKPQIYSEIS